MTDPSFPPKVFALAQQLHQETSQEARKRLSLEIAEEAVQEYDPTDAANVEEYHIYFEDFLKARADYQRAGYRLGRLISQTAGLIQAAESLTN